MKHAANASSARENSARVTSKGATCAKRTCASIVGKSISLIHNTREKGETLEWNSLATF